MIPFHRLCLALIAPLTLSACLELESDFELRADGSGSQRLVLGLNDEMVQRLRVSAQATGAVGDPMAIFDEAAAAAMLEQKGLVMASHRRYRERRREFVELQMQFERGEHSLGGLMGGQAECLILPGRTEGGARLVIYPRGFQAWQTMRQQIKEGVGGVSQQGWFDSQRQRMRGARGTFRIKLPRAVRYCSNNMSKVDDRTVLAKIRPDDLQRPEALLQVLAPRFEVEFDAEGLDLPFDEADPLMR